MHHQSTPSGETSMFGFQIFSAKNYFKPSSLFLSLLTLILLSNPNYANFHGPISVMGDHMHKKGEWMLSYRYMHMNMDGLKNNNNNLSRSDLFSQGYMVAPLEMTMEMHMFGLMYAPSNKVTLMLMLPYIKKEMLHITRPPMKMPMMMPANKRFSTVSEGLGDISATALVKLFESQDHNHHIHANLGISLPTGSIDERDDTFMDNHIKLPYAMQLGSGTVDLKPGITYTGNTEIINFSWGAQANGVIRLGENDNGYQLGNEFQVNTWVAKHWATWIDTSIRLSGKWWGDVNGHDDDVEKMRMMVPTADTNNYGGVMVEAGFGINIHPKTKFAGNRLAIEFSMPVHQDLNGPQMARDWTITTGWQWAF